MESRRDVDEQVESASISWHATATGHHRIQLSGHVDPSVAMRYRRLGAMVVDEATSLEVDLEHVGVFGSWGVEALEHLRDLAAALDVSFTVTNRSERIDRVLDSVGFWLDADLAAEHRPVRIGAGVGRGGHDERDALAAPFVGRPDFEQLISQAVLRGPDALMITSSDGAPSEPRIVFVNRAFTELTGYSGDEVIGASPALLRGALTDDRFFDRLTSPTAEPHHLPIEIIDYRADGSPFAASWRVVTIDGVGDRTTFRASMLADVTVARRLTRFETALTYVDGQAMRLDVDALDGDERVERMLGSMLHAHVALMGGGEASAELRRHDGSTIFATTASDPETIHRIRSLVAADWAGPGRVDAASRASMLRIPISLGADDSWTSGRLILHGMHRDRLRLADPHLHDQLTVHGFGRRI